MTVPAFLGLGFAELLMIGFVALLVFGGRLPEVMRNLGRAYGKFRTGMNELAHPIRQEMRRLDAPDTAKPTPARGSNANDLPPAADTPPEPYAPSGSDGGSDGGSEEALTDGREHAAPADTKVETHAEAKRKPRKTRPTGGAADEPPPV